MCIVCQTAPAVKPDLDAAVVGHLLALDCVYNVRKMLTEARRLWSDSPATAEAMVLYSFRARLEEHAPRLMLAGPLDPIAEAGIWALVDAADWTVVARRLIELWPVAEVERLDEMERAAEASLAEVRADEGWAEYLDGLDVGTAHGYAELAA